MRNDFWFQRQTADCHEGMVIKNCCNWHWGHKRIDRLLQKLWDGLQKAMPVASQMVSILGLFSAGITTNSHNATRSVVYSLIYQKNEKFSRLQYLT